MDASCFRLCVRRPPRVDDDEEDRQPPLSERARDCACQQQRACPRAERERTEEADDRDDEVRALETRGQRRVPVLGAHLRLLAFEVRSRAVLREQLRRPARCAVPLRGPFVVHGRPPGLRVGSRDRLDRCAHDVPGSGQQAVSLVAECRFCCESF